MAFFIDLKNAIGVFQDFEKCPRAFFMTLKKFPRAFFMTLKMAQGPENTRIRKGLWTFVVVGDPMPTSHGVFVHVRKRTTHVLRVVESYTVRKETPRFCKGLWLFRRFEKRQGRFSLI